MNKQRRLRLADAVNLLEQAKEIVEEISSGEMDAYENLPEGLQESERGDKMHENVNELDEITGEIDDLVDRLNEV